MRLYTVNHRHVNSAVIFGSRSEYVFVCVAMRTDVVCTTGESQMTTCEKADALECCIDHCKRALYARLQPDASPHPGSEDLPKPYRVARPRIGKYCTTSSQPLSNCSVLLFGRYRSMLCIFLHCKRIVFWHTSISFKNMIFQHMTLRSQSSNFWLTFIP